MRAQKRALGGPFLVCQTLILPFDREYLKQERSYRQHIARQLRTQYAEGIYMHKYYTMTLKSRLNVTQGHWKQNHWIDHT